MDVLGHLEGMRQQINEVTLSVMRRDERLEAQVAELARRLDAFEVRVGRVEEMADTPDTVCLGDMRRMLERIEGHLAGTPGREGA